MADDGQQAALITGGTSGTGLLHDLDIVSLSASDKERR
jgi:hypothetical protein